MDSPKRKPNRIPHYDYARNGAYFVTICTKNRAQILWRVGARIARPPDICHLSKIGIAIDHAICAIAEHYPCVRVDKYVIMPNHIHLILQISPEGGRAMRAPTISTVINQMKGAVTKQIGGAIWQKSFHDHVIRGEGDFLKIWEYVDTNPEKWGEDCFHPNNAPRLSGRP